MDEGFHFLMDGDVMTLELGITWWKILALVAVIVAAVKLVRYYLLSEAQA